MIRYEYLENPPFSVSSGKSSAKDNPLRLLIQHETDKSGIFKEHFC